MTEIPQYIHDCSQCVFLGRFEYDGPLCDGTTKHLKADLYYCPKGALGPSIIARHGNEGSDYASMPAQVLATHLDRMSQEPATRTPGLLEAYRRYLEATNS